ncbi:HAD hydrolase-like protein, partial [Staphylococcus aureus]|uniref:HAD hydrolase-like protein n=1 Tax=Staphylococcus aureus TaxID=1280 RepID=UPI001642E0A2
DSTTQKLLDQPIPEINSVQRVKQPLIHFKPKPYQLPILTTHTKKPLQQFLPHTNLTSFFHFIISTQPHAYHNPNPKLLSPLFHQYNLHPHKLPILAHTPNHINTPTNPNLRIAIPVLTRITTKQ